MADRGTGPAEAVPSRRTSRSIYALSSRGGGVFGEVEPSSGVVEVIGDSACVNDGCAIESGLETTAVPMIRNAGIPEEQPQASLAAVSDGGAE